MRAQKFGFNKVKVLKIHYNREKGDDGTIKDTSYSLINPARSHLNYNLCKDDMVELVEAKKKTAYIRSQKTDVALYDICIPYPKDCSVSPKKFFEVVYDILTKNKTTQYCVGAFVHMDESNPHMHYVCMPIEQGEFTKSKDVKVFDEKKQKEVTRRIKTTYHEKFNANKMFGKDFFNTLHPFVQKEIYNRGIKGTIITPERLRFNIWKKERIKYYNEQIKKDPAHKEQYIDKFWEEYQRLNPHKYRKDRAKDQRLEDFKKLQDLVEKEKYKVRKLEVKQEKIEKELSDKEIALKDMNKKIAEAGSMMVTTDRLKQLEKENQDKINKKIKEQEMTQKRLDSETKKMNKTISDTKTQIKIIAELETKLQNEEISRQQAIEELRKGDLEDIIKNFKLKSTPKINELVIGIDKNNFNTDEDDDLDGI